MLTLRIPNSVDSDQTNSLSLHQFDLGPLYSLRKCVQIVREGDLIEAVQDKFKY